MGLTSLSFPFLLEAQAVTAKKREWAMAWRLGGVFHQHEFALIACARPA
jgi:hypothetical protein